MRATTVRFGEDLWAMLEQEAAASGVSVAQFVREAAILRLAMLAGMRGDDAAHTTIASLASSVQRPAEDPVAKAIADPGRLAALERTQLLDTPPEERFDSLTRVAARVLQAPVALVSLVDSDRQFFKSCLGLPEPWASRRGTPLSHSFCMRAVAAREPLIVEDARKHPVLRDNPAIRDLGVVAYAGIPLMSEDSEPLGTLCVIDNVPRHWKPEETALLTEIADAVSAQIQTG